MQDLKHSLQRVGVTRQDTEPPPVLVDLLAEAGCRFNGSTPWDIQVRDASVYRRILTHGSLGFGESYMDGDWECPELDKLFTRLLTAEIDEKLVGWTRVRLVGAALRELLFNHQTPRRAFQVGERHYDTGNDLFEAMLDPSMSYSCAYWKEADDLAAAQQAKLELICRKLELSRGDHLLDIGCGWGGLAQYAVRHYGVRVTGITVSREQQVLARERCAKLPVDIELMDYREIQGEFDKVVSVGMFEHVGPKNYEAYFDTVRRVLKKDGLCLLHTIGSSKTVRGLDPWMEKYIFPNGRLPSAAQLAGVLNGRLLIEDWHSFGPDYDRTLMAWWQRFDRAWPELRAHYGQRFYRMWRYYLLSCAGFFRSRRGQLWQLVLVPPGRRAVYRSVR